MPQYGDTDLASSQASLCVGFTDGKPRCDYNGCGAKRKWRSSCDKGANKKPGMRASTASLVLQLYRGSDRKGVD